MSCHRTAIVHSGVLAEFVSFTIFFRTQPAPLKTRVPPPQWSVMSADPCPLAGHHILPSCHHSSSPAAWPSGLPATLVTLSLWPSRVSNSSPLVPSHTSLFCHYCCHHQEPTVCYFVRPAQQLSEFPVARATGAKVIKPLVDLCQPQFAKSDVSEDLRGGTP